jgi:membrane associated rhomboid family serine protease
MIPLKDDNPTSRFPIITVLLIVINSLVFIYTDILGLGGREFILKYSAIPYNIVTLGSATGEGPIPALSSIISSQFLHGGLLHIAGNMLFLWIFGNNVEDRLGRPFFVIFYLLCGSVAVFAQIVGDPYSRMPMIGASGSIAGVMAAYLLAFPRARVLTLVWIIFFIQLVWLPAFVIIIYWIFLQVLYQLTTGHQAGGVAYLAHIGGFAAGFVTFYISRGFQRKIS